MRPLHKPGWALLHRRMPVADQEKATAAGQVCTLLKQPAYTYLLSSSMRILRYQLLCLRCERQPSTAILLEAIKLCRVGEREKDISSIRRIDCQHCQVTANMWQGIPAMTAIVAAVGARSSLAVDHLWLYRRDGERGKRSLCVHQFKGLAAIERGVDTCIT